MDFYGKSGPGPGDYDPYQENILRPENANVQGEETFRYEARLPRYHELIQKDEEKKVSSAWEKGRMRLGNTGELDIGRDKTCGETPERRRECKGPTEREREEGL